MSMDANFTITGLKGLRGQALRDATAKKLENMASAIRKGFNSDAVESICSDGVINVKVALPWANAKIS